MQCTDPEIPVGDLDKRSDPITTPTEDRTAGVSEDATLATAHSGLVQIFPRSESAVPAVWKIDGEVSLGRSRQAGIRLDDEKVSRLHALVVRKPRGLLVRDAGSRHGSFVNGEPVASAGILAEYGSLARFADTLMLVVDDVEGYCTEPRLLEGARLGLSANMIAGPKLASVWDQATRISRLNDPVFVVGESGSGKECVARIVHAMRPQPGPFVGLNVAAIPEPLFEAELFGYERGSFTGANVARSGAFRNASGGVLFLDEVGDLRPDLQSKLLRAIDLGCVRPLGASRDVPVSVRIVAATSLDLREACQTGAFRMDLYYRLTGIVIRVPPLRERRDDILLLAASMLKDQAPNLTLSVDAAEALALASWEGNVRNLRYAVTHGVGQAIASGCCEIQKSHLPDVTPVHPMTRELTEDRIRWAMTKSGGVAAHAAEKLGVSRTTLYNALKRLDIDAAELRAK